MKNVQIENRTPRLKALILWSFALAEFIIDLNLGFKLRAINQGQKNDSFPTPDILGSLVKYFLLETHIKSIKLLLLAVLISSGTLLTCTNLVMIYAARFKNSYLSIFKNDFFTKNKVKLAAFKANYLLLKVFFFLIIETNICHSTIKLEKKSTNGPSVFNLGGGDS